MEHLKCNRCGCTTENIKRHQKENKKTCDSLREMYDGDCNRDSKLFANKLNRKFKG